MIRPFCTFPARFAVCSASLCAVLLAGCVTPLSDPDGPLPPAGMEATRFVRQYCAHAERDRTALSEGMRRALWPDAQFIIVCDH